MNWSLSRTLAMFSTTLIAENRLSEAVALVMIIRTKAKIDQTYECIRESDVVIDRARSLWLQPDPLPEDL